MVGWAARGSEPAHERCLLENRDVMPKMKTNRAAAKRFKKTGTGRVRRAKAGLQHGMISKNRKHCRRLRKNDMVHKAMEKRIKLLIPYD